MNKYWILTNTFSVSTDAIMYFFSLICCDTLYWLVGQSDHMDHSLSNSMKLSYAMWGHSRETGHGERSDRMWSTGEGNDKRHHYSCLENPMNSMKRQKDRTLTYQVSRWEYATEDRWRNNSRKNEGMEPKQKQYSAMDVTGDRSKV